MNATLRGPLGLVRLDNEVLTIGRSKQNRLVYTHPQMSSKHAEIRPLGSDRYQLMDLGSSNGTSVNGFRLNAGTPYPLSDGDTLVLGGAGGVEFVFAWRADAAQEAALLPQPEAADQAVIEELETRAEVWLPPAGAPARLPADGGMPGQPAQGAAPAAIFPPPPPLPGAWAMPEHGSPLARPWPPQAPGGPALAFRRPETPAAPGPGPLPAAITSVSRYKRPPKVWLFGGSLLVLVLVIVGVALGGKVLGGQPTKPSPAAPPAVIRTANVTIQGQAKTVLTNAQGLTLYYFTPDTARTAACTGGCATTWPPLLFRGTGAPTAAPTLPGTLNVQQNANGPQVEYNGHLLYTFSGDKAPGQTKGEGAGGKWFVATPTLAVQR